MRNVIVVIALFALFFSAAGYVRVTYPTFFSTLFQTATSKPSEPIADTQTTETTNNASTKITPLDENGNPIITPATYEDYAPDKIARAATAPVVLFFNASWCPSCISTDRIFKKKIANLPPGVSVLSVDYDTATELKEKYSITYQHTFIQVDAAGNELARWSGGAIDGIIANLVQ